MSKRLQVLFEEDELDEIRESAGLEGLTVADWVRQALRSARRDRPRHVMTAKLEAIADAARYSFPLVGSDADDTPS